MSAPPDESRSARAAIDDAAAAWVARRDRGLTPAEQDAFFLWLAADPRHGERFARHQRGWSELAHLAQWRPEHGAEPNADVLAPPAGPRRPRSGRLLRWIVPPALAAAACVAFVIHSTNRALPPATPVAAESGYRQLVLDDGSLVELNRGAQFTAAFTPGERRVVLERGEALFTVAKNPARPFIVEVAGVTVRAVGTAFNVRLGPAAVDVLVTEGRVQLDRPAAPFATPALLSAGQHAVMPLVGPAPVATQFTPADIERVLAWQPKLLEFAATPLADVVAEFNRRNAIHILVADDALRSLPIGASFRSDNVDGFVRLLEASFGVRVERDATTITLHRTK